MPPLLLASASPRRKQYLLELGFEFRVVPSHADETQLEAEEAEVYARRIARVKASAAAGSLPGAVVLAADTVVVAGGDVLGKPADEQDFQRIMGRLSGRTHEVITAVVARVIGGQTFEQAVRTKVTFRTLGEEEISWYWATNEPKDKAGGYALQGRGGAFVTAIEGSHSNVVGLPLVETLAMLDAAGVKPPWMDPRLRR
jgi:septum formation protein